MSRLIDADKVIAKVDLSYLTLSLLIGQEESRIAVAEIKRLIREIPTVDAEPIRHGHWIKDRLDSIRKCSLCGAVIYRHEDLFDYCPWCGTRMDEVEEDEID